MRSTQKSYVHCPKLVHSLTSYPSKLPIKLNSLFQLLYIKLNAYIYSKEDLLYVQLSQPSRKLTMQKVSFNEQQHKPNQIMNPSLYYILHTLTNSNTQLSNVRTQANLPTHMHNSFQASSQLATKSISATQLFHSIAFTLHSPRAHMHAIILQLLFYPHMQVLICCMKAKLLKWRCQPYLNHWTSLRQLQQITLVPSAQVLCITSTQTNPNACCPQWDGGI